MNYPIRLSDGLVFEPKVFVKKTWQKWVEPVPPEPKGRFIKSDVWVEGLKPVYIFEIGGQQLELSRDQVQQVLISAFDAKKHWKECKFVAKSNGKEKLEKRWYINIAKEGIIYPENPAGQSVPQSEVELDDILF